MSKSGSTKSKSEENNKNEYFSRSDKEVESLLNVVIEFKASKSFSKSFVFRMFCIQAKLKF